MISDNSSSKKCTGAKKTVKGKKEKEHRPKYNRPHMIIPLEDSDWALSQKPSVAKLWLECWRCDQYGTRPEQLNTTLPYSTFMEAKKAIADAGLFLFKPEKSFINGRETVCWRVQNLHGSRIKSYWQPFNSGEPEFNSGEPEFNSGEPEFNSGELEYNSGSPESQPSKRLLCKDSSPPSVSSQEHLSISSKEVLRWAELSAAKESGTNSADENLIRHPVSPIRWVEEKLDNQGSPGEVKDLEAHFEAAQEGIKPPDGVMEELRNSKYWTGYVVIAKQNGWEMQPRESTMTPEARQVMETLKAKKKQPWLKGTD